MSESVLSRLVALVLLLAIAPLLPGLASRTRAVLTGRRGAPVGQLYRDLAKLLRKEAIYSNVTTGVFQLAPAVLLATVLTCALLIPLDGRGALVSFSGDAIAFVSLLALGRFLLVLAAMDTGSSFEGMGASREVTFASFVEPGFLLCFLALSVATGSLQLGGMLGPPLGARWTITGPSLVLVAGAFFVLLLAENARGPVEDPDTHLELTMIHEVMVLDHSGPDLALILYAGAVKLALCAALLVRVLVSPLELATVPSLAALIAGMALAAVAVGIVETSMARLRLTRISLFIVSGSALAGFGLVLLLR